MTNSLGLTVRSQSIANESRTQISIAAEALESILGVKTAFMRPPFGSYSDTVLQVANAHNQSVIIWDFEYVRLFDMDFI